ncbi:MAG TPA: hypothetical protein VH599_03835 [Ktedonobacterales bacterium]|jgi:hypothetical protein
MANYNFWRSERIRLRAIEQKDLDDLFHSPEEFDQVDPRIDLPEYGPQEVP